MATIDRAFGQAVRERRRELLLSQEALGFQAGIHRTYISQIERGVKSPSLKVIQVIAFALKTPMYELIRDTEKYLKQSANHE